MGPDGFLLLPGDGLILIDAEGHVTHADRNAREMLAAEDLSGSRLEREWRELWNPVQAFAKRPPDGGPVDVQVKRGASTVSIRLFATDTGVGVVLLAPSADREDAHTGLMDTYRRMFDAISDVVLVTTAEPIDLPGPLIVYANDSLLRQTGYRPSEVLGRSPRMFQGPGTNVGDRLRFRNALSLWSPLLIEMLNHAKDGTPYWVEIELTPLADASGRYTHWFSIQRDVTERRRATSALLSQAFKDPLTGLPNRRALHDRLDRSLLGLPRHPEVLTVMFCDLDDFKLVNDSLGHPAGDMLLVELTSRMNSVLRPDDTLVRLGGDEFVVLCEGMGGAAESAHLAIRLQEAIGAPWSVGDEVFHPQMSVGIAVADHAGLTGDELLRRADVAMYQAKGAGRNRVEVYDPSADGKTQFAITLQHDLRSAIDSDELVLEYQPIVRLADSAIIAAEALVRLVDRHGDLVSASSFVPLAEVSGLIVPMGDWVMKRVFRDMQAWRDRHLDLEVAINVSPAQVREPDFAERFLEQLHTAGVDPAKVTLEITETTLMHNPVRKARELTILRESGVGVALDDFGVGYSSLAWLVDFPLTSVKLDRRHTAAMMEDERVVVIMSALIGVCRDLGLSTVAEGVETVEQRDRLLSLGCQYGQGYLFGPSAAPKDSFWVDGLPSRRR